MKHQKSNIDSFSTSFFLLIVLFITNVSFLSAAPPIDILDHQEEVIDKKDKKAAKATKKRSKKAFLQKIKTDKKSQKSKASRGNTWEKILLTSLLVFIIIISAASVFALLGGLGAWFFGSSPWIMISGMGGIALSILGWWFIREKRGKRRRPINYNRKGAGPWLKWLLTILIAIATLFLASLIILSLSFGANILIFLGIPVVFLGVWSIIKIHKSWKN